MEDLKNNVSISQRKNKIVQFETMVALARHHAKFLSNKQFIQWLDRGNVEAGSYTYSSLDINSRALAVDMQRKLSKNVDFSFHQEEQKVALIIVQPGLSFVVSFFACLYAGIIAVPTYPPKKNESLEKLKLLIGDSEANLILTDKETLAFIKDVKKEKLPLILTDDIDESLAHLWEFPNIDKNSIAFYQYTSGSTGTPKGVVISHHNLMMNQQTIAHAMNHDADSVIVGWLPMFHDMGLIGNLLQPFYLGANCILMSPISFIINPIRWLSAITKYKATSSGGPNFAYDLCVSRTTPRQREELDLSSWKIAFNGSETIWADTLNSFSSVFKKHKFSATSLYPCYGMAESTLLITGALHNKIPKILEVDTRALADDEILIDTKRCAESSGGERVATVSLVSSGIACKKTLIKIIDPIEKIEKIEKTIGEIWVNSESVAREYIGKPKFSVETFHAKIENKANGLPYLRTGDLGFMFNSELFVTGRLKDLIIINGKNHYPQDIEKTVLAEDPMLVGSTAAAFSIDYEKKEMLVVVLHVKKNMKHKIDIEKTRKSIYARVTRQHNVKIFDFVISSSRLPTTSSGKIQRSKCRDLYQKNDLETEKFKQVGVLS